MTFRPKDGPGCVLHHGSSPPKLPKSVAKKAEMGGPAPQNLHKINKRCLTVDGAHIKRFISWFLPQGKPLSTSTAGRAPTGSSEGAGGDEGVRAHQTPSP